MLFLYTKHKTLHARNICDICGEQRGLKICSHEVFKIDIINVDERCISVMVMSVPLEKVLFSLKIEMKNKAKLDHLQQ